MPHDITLIGQCYVILKAQWYTNEIWVVVVEVVNGVAAMNLEIRVGTNCKFKFDYE